MSGNPGKFNNTKTDRMDRSGRGKTSGEPRKGGQGGKQFRDDPTADPAEMDKGDPCYDSGAGAGAAEDAAAAPPRGANLGDFMTEAAPAPSE